MAGSEPSTPFPWMAAPPQHQPTSIDEPSATRPHDCHRYDTVVAQLAAIPDDEGAYGPDRLAAFRAWFETPGAMPRHRPPAEEEERSGPRRHLAIASRRPITHPLSTCTSLLLTRFVASTPRMHVFRALWNSTPAVAQILVDPSHGIPNDELARHEAKQWARRVVSELVTAENILDTQYSVQPIAILEERHPRVAGLDVARCIVTVPYAATLAQFMRCPQVVPSSHWMRAPGTPGSDTTIAVALCLFERLCEAAARVADGRHCPPLRPDRIVVERNRQVRIAAFELGIDADDAASTRYVLPPWWGPPEARQYSWVIGALALDCFAALYPHPETTAAIAAAHAHDDFDGRCAAMLEVTVKLITQLKNITARASGAAELPGPLIDVQVPLAEVPMAKRLLETTRATSQVPLVRRIMPRDLVNHLRGAGIVAADQGAQLPNLCFMCSSYRARYGLVSTLHFAVDHGQVECTRTLIRECGALLWSHDDTDAGMNILCSASRRNDGRHVVAALIEAGAPDAGVGSMRAAEWAVRHGATLALAELAESGYDLSGRNGSTLFHVAAESDGALSLQELLKHPRAGDPCARDTHNDTPMHVAARLGYVDVIQVLLAAGAPATPALPPSAAALAAITSGTSAKDGPSPLALAVRGAHVLCAIALVCGGAEPSEVPRSEVDALVRRTEVKLAVSQWRKAWEDVGQPPPRLAMEFLGLK